ncbi:MAG: hypothetical protein ACT4P3_16075, partial [Betaproteobacteria bacterium]
MGNRVFLAVVLFVAAVSAAFNARAEERINLRYPGWALTIDRNEGIVSEADQRSDSRTFSLRLSSAELASQTGWRVPLRESMFLTLEAMFSMRHINPA